MITINYLIFILLNQFNIHQFQSLTNIKYEIRD